jgi:ribosomal protein S18
MLLAQFLRLGRQAETALQPEDRLDPDVTWFPPMPDDETLEAAHQAELPTLAQIDPLNVPLLMRYVDAFGMTKSRKQTGLPAKLQRKVSRALRVNKQFFFFECSPKQNLFVLPFLTCMFSVKRARHMGLLSSKHQDVPMSVVFLFLLHSNNDTPRVCLRFVVYGVLALRGPNDCARREFTMGS